MHDTAAHTAADKAFLELFPRPERSLLANIFLNAIRKDGADSPGRLLTTAARDIFRRIESENRWLSSAGSPQHRLDIQDRIEKYRRYQAALSNHFDAAVRYAEWCIWYELLPYAERQRVKQAQYEQFREEQTATEPQRRFLAALGYRGDAATLTKQAASDLITQLKAAQR